jgi:hypothetical protein
MAGAPTSVGAEGAGAAAFAATLFPGAAATAAAAPEFEGAAVLLGARVEVVLPVVWACARAGRITSVAAARHPRTVGIMRILTTPS